MFVSRLRSLRPEPFPSHVSTECVHVVRTLNPIKNSGRVRGLSEVRRASLSSRGEQARLFAVVCPARLTARPGGGSRIPRPRALSPPPPLRFLLLIPGTEPVPSPAAGLRDA